MTLSIKQKILSIILLNALFLLAAGAIGYIGIQSMNAAKDRLVSTSELNKNLLMAANSRDNLRAIIYRGVALDQSNPEEKKEMQEEFTRQIASFRLNIETLANIGFDSTVARISDQANTFENMSRTLFEKQLAGDMEAFMLIASFIESYEALVQPMQTLSVHIDATYQGLALRGNQEARAAALGIGGVAAIGILASFTISLLIAHNISKRIRRTQNIIADVSLGKTPKQEHTTDKDEIGTMLTSLNGYLRAVDNTARFAEAVGHGNFDTVYQPLSDEDKLGLSLLEMRDNLKRSHQADSQRNWVTSGLARLNEILRTDSLDLERLAEKVLAYAVQYVGCNQGCMYVLEDENGQDYMILRSTYAWGRKKFMESRVTPGQGLIGQAWLEGEMIYMTDVPANFVKITSGLGEATPRCILIVPLKIHGQLYGMLEIASIQELEVHQREFLLKISESIASTISGMRTALQTSRLLQQATQQSDQMNIKDEESRQHLEELMAIQEEIGRKEKQYISRITQLTNTIEEQQEEIRKLNERPTVDSVMESVAEALRKQEHLPWGGASPTQEKVPVPSKNDIKPGS